MTKNHFDVHQQVTDQIVAMLERSAGEFRLPWHRLGGHLMRPVNVASNKPYRGINILNLWATAEDKGFSSGLWGTYRQWQAAGGHVRKGEKAAFVVVFKETFFTAHGCEGDEPSKRLFARASPVFAAEQVDNWTAPCTDTSSIAPAKPIEQAEVFIKATKAFIAHGGSRAYYQPSTDTIQIPPREDFIGTSTSSPTESYYAVLLHELGHWTSSEHRCNRRLGKRFGDHEYAVEELIAELSSAFLCGDIGITPEPRPDHAHYLQLWLAIMKADKKAIFAAASEASKAAVLLTALQNK